MNRLKPPALATWLLEHIVLRNKNDALAGDLLEEFERRRSPVWYWRQVIASIWILPRVRLRVALAVALLVVWIVRPTGVPVRDAAPDFTLRDAKGGVVRLSDYKGKVVLLNFWATWCEACAEEIPWYVDFQSKYGASGLSVVGVSLDEGGWNSVKLFLSEKKVNYPVVIGNRDLANSYGGVPSLPWTFLIDRNGNIADSHVGLVDKRVFENKVRTLFQVNARPAPK